MVLGAAGQPWTEAEIETAMEAYFSMLSWQLEGKPFNKSDVRLGVGERLPTRTKGSIEMQWSHISAVLDERSLAWLEGYRPLGNYQATLADAVDGWLRRYPDVADAIGA